MRLSVRKRDWEPGKFQVLIYVRTPEGDELCTQADRLSSDMGGWVEEVQRAILRKTKPRTFWERIIGICSAHREPDPNCKLCQTTPEAIFPDWADATAQAEVAGETVCKKCGFKFYRTVTSCPACNHPAVPTLAEVMNSAEELFQASAFMETKTRETLEGMYFYLRHILGRFRRNIKS